MCKHCDQPIASKKHQLCGRHLSRFYKHGDPLAKVASRATVWEPTQELYAVVKRRCDKYGITVQQYDAMREAQANLCAICSCEMKVACIDHCHTDGRVRGLLCQPCNTGLGFFKEDPENLARAIQYLAMK